MKTLNFNGEKLQAENIIKTDTDIIGYDENNKEIFAFRGISDFTLFTLEEGQVFDISDEDKKNHRLTDLEVAMAAMLGGGM